MNWLARVFARALVRRTVYAFMALLLAWAGLGHAEAQTTKNCSIDGTNCTPAEASAQCNAFVITGNSSIPGGVTRRECQMSSGQTTGRFVLVYWGLNSQGKEVGQFLGGTWYWRNQCSSEPSKTTPFFPPSGSVRCISNCEVTYRQNEDDTTTYSPNGRVCDRKPDCAAQGKNMVWNAMLGVCQPVEPECPPGKVMVGNTCADEKPCPDGMALVNGSCKKEDNECPSGMIRSPLGNCIPGDGQCAQGEVRGPDGTCKRDSDNDGDPDPTGPDDPETFSGGDACNAPPSCSGSPIMCGQARIQWRIDCNTRRNNNISGGHCSQSGMPVCTGEKCNAMEYAGLLMQWRSACALEKMAGEKSETPGSSKTDANGNGVPDALEGRGEVTGVGDNAADIASAKKWGIGLSTDSLDTSNMFGGAGTCPEPPAITIMGKTVTSADFPHFCRIAAILRALILIFGAYSAIRILMGGIF